MSVDALRSVTNDNATGAVRALRPVANPNLSAPIELAGLKQGPPVDLKLTEYFASVQEVTNVLDSSSPLSTPPLQQSALPPSPGGGDNDGMPPDDKHGERIAVLETHVKHIQEDISGIRSEIKDVRGDIRDVRSDVGALKVSVARIEENVRHLPTKGWAFTIAAGIVTFMVAVSALTPKIQQLFGTAPPAINTPAQQPK